MGQGGRRAGSVITHRWRCKLCPKEGTAISESMAFDALGWHVGRHHPTDLFRAGVVVPIDALWRDQRCVTNGPKEHGPQEQS